MASYVLILQHLAVEGPGLIARALELAGVQYRIRNLLQELDPALPPLEELSGVVLMGGPMDADDLDRYPALALEQKLIRAAVASEIPVLGVCLGHQLIALALGGGLQHAATREIGVAAISATGELTALNGLDVVHWHGDNAVLPEGVASLARTEDCGTQAFRHGSALGLQFHLELDAELLDTWLASGMAEDLAEGEGEKIRKDFMQGIDARTRAASEIFQQFSRECLVAKARQIRQLQG
ncbi:type 1 glutamine amidotransferase [Psychromicrobium xiongbiense]|uniref:type 1 glutamine amidotransferase n=1 Tax=Psychromicrobium xiongbiense TaxID=3051184 RepID=UPI00255722E3|nr:type 1 glutamine amidotransferase [Psychromicrobium sp. YIM S02556]